VPGFAVVGKLAQTVFPGGAMAAPFKPKLSNSWIRESVIGDSFLLGATVIAPLVVTQLRQLEFSLLF
jgi:hypothetical protein